MTEPGRIWKFIEVRLQRDWENPKAQELPKSCPKVQKLHSISVFHRHSMAFEHAILFIPTSAKEMYGYCMSPCISSWCSSGQILECLTLLAAAVSYWAINPGFWSCVQPWGILPAREKLAWDPWDKEGFLCCQSLAVWHHSLSNFVQHHRWKQLAEERIRRSDLASDDSQAFRKSWQDGETARRRDGKTASSHETCGSHEPYVLHGSHDMNQNTWNHMKSGVCF